MVQPFGHGISRRQMLARLGAGFGTLALAPSIAQGAASDALLLPKRPHHAPRAKRVIQLFMPGGPSHVDTFDYKPDIARYEGQRPKIVDRRSLRNTKNGLMPSPFRFKQYGQSGKWISEIFPASCSPFA